MAKQGFVFINPNYHLAPERKFPVQLTDINQVLKWMVMYRGKYHMDLENVFLVGDSAGAQIASHFCTIYSNEKFAKEFDFQISKQVKIRAMALNCGMYDILSLAQDTGVEETTEFKDNKALMDEYLGEDYESKRKQLDLLNHITGQFPPTFLMTSYYDFLKEYAEPMYRLLTSRGVLTSYKIYGEEGQEHMGHVFHCNMNLKEAEQCNIDECNFFRKFIV